MRPPPLSPIAVHESIERFCAHAEPLRLTGHARERMRVRRFTVDDILHVLRHGTVDPKATWDANSRAWKYVVRYRQDGEPLSVVIALDDGITVITGYD